MAGNIEALTVLAIIEAEDRASGILGGIFSQIGRVADAYKAAGDAAAESGKLQDAGLLEGATAAERLTNAETALADSQTRAYETSAALRNAQVELAASLDEEGKATDATAAAQARLRQAQLDNTIATGNLRDAQLAQSTASTEVTTKTDANRLALGTAANAMIGVGAATAIAAGYSVDLAGKFQAQTQVLVSGAGVQQNQLDGVRSKLLQLSVATGTSASDLSNAFFSINSRLGNVSESETAVGDAAEIAKAHMADLNTVGIAIANTMNSYAGKGYTATQVSNILGSAVENGGMSFQQLASSLSTVLPLASSMGISLPQVAGALATMTTQGMSANQATQNLSHTIQHISGPTATMLSTWDQMGITQKQVASALSGPGGLQAALNLITNTAETKVGPGGQIVINTFKQSQDATAALTTMLNNMNPAARSLAEQLQNGTLAQYNYTKAARLLGEGSAVQAQQFLALENKANGYNDALKAGKPGFANFDALLKSAYGDSTSLNTALLLGGAHAKTWAKNTTEAAQAGDKSNKSIQGWSATQQTLNFKLSQAKEALSAAAIQLGTALIPAVTGIVKDISPWIDQLAPLIAHHQTMTKAIVAAGLAIGVMGVALKGVLGVYNMFTGVKDMITGIKSAIDDWQLSTKLAGAATAIWEGIQTAFNAVMTATGVVMDFLADNPIILIIAAVVAVIAIVVLAYNKFAWFRDFINGVWNVIKEGAVAVWHGLVAAFNGIISAAEAVGSFLSGVWNGIWSTIQSVWNGISDFFKKWWPLLLVIFAFPIAVLIAIWNHFHEQITAVAKDVWNGIKEFFSIIWDAIKTGAQTAWNQFQEYIVTPLKFVWNFLVQGWNNAVKQLQQAWNIVVAGVKWAWNLFKQWVITPLQETLSFLDTFASGVWNKISGAFNKVLGWLEGVNQWFMQIGSDIINGIISGVENGASALFGSLKNLASGALNAAKSFLGISSPSKEFANQVGKWIPHGVALGVTANTQTALDAVKKMATALPHAIGVQGAVNLGVSGLGQAGTVYGTGIGLGVNPAGAAGGINLNVDLRGAVVAGDKGIQDLTNKIGNAVATKILPQAGVRFH